MQADTAQRPAAEVRVRYGEAPAPTVAEGTFQLHLPTDGERAAARIKARLAKPGVVRDALLAMGDILMTDLRFKARDRSDYLAYLLSKGKRATQAVWDAQKEFLEARYGEAVKEEAPLDPVLTVSEEGLSLEVFSKDESAYARLHLRAGVAYTALEASAGTTHLELTEALLKSIGRMRSYRASTLELAPLEGGRARELRVPYRWLRAFGQVQAASMLPAEHFDLAPIDLYNVLYTLRRQRAKKAPRALRYELIPGERPRIVLEPWDLVLEGTGGPFTGRRSMVVRTWGRARLAVLARLLPVAKRVRVGLVGPGLPAYYVVDFEEGSLTLALSGWTDSGWAGIATFDLLAPVAADEIFAKRVLELAGGAGRTLDELAEAAGRDRAEVRQVVLAELTRGQLVHDLVTDRFQRRPLFAQPLEAERLRYRDRREEQAHRLLAVDGQVDLVKVHDLGEEGTAIEGTVEDRAAHRAFRPSFTLDREGSSTKAACTCTAFRRAGIKEGPCEHMMALRLLYARRQAALEKARGSEEGRRLIRAETRTLLRREKEGKATLYKVSLDDRQVLLRFGEPRSLDEMRLCRLLFGNAEEARSEYFARLAALEARGFIDTFGE
jgi:hypothetical protein